MFATHKVGDGVGFNENINGLLYFPEPAWSKPDLEGTTAVRAKVTFSCAHTRDGVFRGLSMVD